MVTLSDPILKRLVEVNPAPDDLELPPVSDAALLESIVERAHSEEVRFRPTAVRLRSWRPGVVVAAVAFVAVLVVAGAIGLLSGVYSEREGPVVTEPPTVTTVAPVPTTTPPTVTTVAPTPTTAPPTVTTAAPTPTVVPQYEVTILGLDDGSFSASGPAVDAGVVCSEGTIETITISQHALTSRFPTGGDYSDAYTAVEERTLTCADGTGSIVIGMVITQAQLTTGYHFTGQWVVVRGAGDYERVAGGGDLDGRCDTERLNCEFEYTGRLDLSRDLETTTSAAAPSGRRDVAIVVEGGFSQGLFTATGSAVDTGFFCPNGSMLGLSEQREDGSGEWEHTVFCRDRSGRMTLGISQRQSSGPNPEYRFSGTWKVIDGSGAYDSATGAGTFSGITLDDHRSHTWTYSGQLEMSE